MIPRAISEAHQIPFQRFRKRRLFEHLASSKPLGHTRQPETAHASLEPKPLSEQKPTKYFG